jgi:hypothetical protein
MSRMMESPDLRDKKYWLAALRRAGVGDDRPGAGVLAPRSI